MDLNALDTNIELMLALCELDGEQCHLNHGPLVDENPAAVEYLCQGFGDQETDTVQQEVRIPICEECANALYNEDWILVYCTFCNNSQWIYRPQAKLEYPDGNGIYWLDLCPFCTKVKNKWEGGEEA